MADGGSELSESEKIQSHKRDLSISANQTKVAAASTRNSPGTRRYIMRAKILPLI